MSWIAVLPLKGEGERKSRLAEVMDGGARDRLALAMARRVIAVMTNSKLFARVLVLSPTPVDLDGEWVADGGDGLNGELAKLRVRFAAQGFCAVHPDLPFLTREDVGVLLEAASRGIAVAPDRRAIGTNAVAIASDKKFDFAFGPASFALHRASGGAIVRRDGLAFDIDTPEDLADARERGFIF